MTTTDLPEFDVTLTMARKTGPLHSDVEYRAFTLRGPAIDAEKAEHIAYGLGHGINDATDHAWKFHGRSDCITVQPASDEPTVAELRAELDEVRAQLADTQQRAHTDATNLQQILRDKTALANERDALKQRLADAYTDGRNTAAADIENMPINLGDAGWKHLERKATEAGYPADAVRRRRTRDDFTTATIEVAYQYGYRTAAKVARGEVAR